MPGLKTRTRGESLITQLWRITAWRIVECISPINPVNGLVRPRLCAGHGKLRPQGGASWEKYGPEIYACKHKQKGKKDGKERCWHTAWLDYSKSKFVPFQLLFGRHINPITYRLSTFPPAQITQFESWRKNYAWKIFCWWVTVLVKFWH